MSKRTEIQDGSQFNWLKRGLVYTEVLGWIDMGHARGDDIAVLKRQFHEGESSGKDYYTVVYRQEMGFTKFSSKISIGKFAKWKIKRGRSNDDINKIMLSMMMNTALSFEKFQSLRPFSWYTDSGFSGEDLVSDLFGFYRFLTPGDYSYKLKPVSYAAAIRRWDYYGPIGSHKKKNFRPMLYPDPVNPCIKHHPYLANLPHFMTWLYPWHDFTSGTVGVVTDDGTLIDFRGS